MKIGEIREIGRKELGERIESEVGNQNEMVLNDWMCGVENGGEIKKLGRRIGGMKGELGEREVKK